jgi:hypothetical protein
MNPLGEVSTCVGIATKEPFPLRSKLLSLSGGGSPIQVADIIDMNLHLLPRLPIDLRAIAANMMNFDWDSLSNGTLWFFKRDDQGHITAAVLNDLRDHYTRLFCETKDCADVLEEALDWTAESIYFGAAFEPQIPYIERAMRDHRYHSKNGFDLYPSISLSDYEKFQEARNNQKTLPTGFVSDSLKWPTDSDYVDASWTYHSPTSHITIGESIYSRPSVCIRDLEKIGMLPEHSSSMVNDLVGWEITRSDYSLGSLKVIELYRLKGFGKWLSTELTSKIIAVTPIPEIASVAVFPHPKPIAFVDKDNIASIKLHEGLGFQLSSSFGWTCFNRHDIHLTHTVS